MIQTVTRIFGLSINNKIFSTKAKSRDLVKLVCYSTFLGDTPPAYFIKMSKHTVLIPLDKSDEELIMSAKSKTRNQIRKAIKDNVVCKETNDVNGFVSFYNDFARERGLDMITRDACIKYGKSLILTKAEVGNNILCYHASIKDDETSRGLLLYSASGRFSENVDRTMIGNANRYLHYYDFCKLRDKGIKYYDFGGIYVGNEDKAKLSIADFKKSFGGEIVTIFTYYSPLFYALKSILGVINRIKDIVRE